MDIPKSELYRQLDDAVLAGYIKPGSAPIAIARKWIEDGYNSLSTHQKTEYFLHVAPYVRDPKAGAWVVDPKMGL